MMSNVLADTLELWGFESDVMVYKDFSLGRMLKVYPIDASCFVENDLFSLKSRLSQMLNSLPTGARIQFFQEVVPDAKPIVDHFLSLKSESTSEIVTRLTNQKAQTLLEQEACGTLVARPLYLTIRLRFQKVPKQTHWLKAFLQPSSELTYHHLAQEIVAFNGDFEKIRLGLKQAGLASEEMAVDETLQLIYRQWNPDLPLELAPRQLQDIRDQLIQTDQVVNVDSFSLGRVFHKTISLKALPETTYASMITTLRQLPQASGLYLSVEVLDQEKERSLLETQRRVAFATVVGKKGVADLDSEAKLKSLEGLLSELVQGSEKVFRMALNVVVKSTDSTDLDRQVAEALYQIRDLSGAEGFLETFGACDVYREIALPNAKGGIRSHKVNTSVLADFLPIYGAWKGHKTPRILLKSSEWSLFPFDPFSEELSNSNQLVSGGSGGGKSFLCNLLILQMLKERPKIFILDVGGSYKKLCANLGGQYIELGLKSQHSLNPLDLTGLSGNDEEIIHQKIKFLVSLIELMTKESELSAIGRYERAEVEKAITEIIRAKTNPTLSCIKDALTTHGDSTISRLGKILNLWCGNSAYGKFFDRQTSVALESDIICFDLKGMESHPDLQAVTLFIITDLIWREVQKDRTQMKFCIMDECWRLLQSDSACFFIGDIFRTFRKYRASAVAISQTIEDFSKSKVAGAILPNASIKWILRQRGDFGEMQRALGLNSKEVALVNDLVSIKGKFSESFLMCEDKRQLVRIEASPLEYWIATTDPMDLKALNDLREADQCASEFTILERAAALYPQGLSNQKIN